MSNREIRPGDYEALYRDFANELVRFVRHHFPAFTPEQVEDVCASAWTAAIQADPEWESDRSIRAYLYSAARAKALNMIRGMGRKPADSLSAIGPRDEDGESQDGEAMIAGSANVEGEVGQRAVLEEVADLPGELGRVALLLAAGHGPKGIAEALGISERAARKRITKAREELRRRLAD